MTRGLHADTQVQRAEQADAVSPELRKRGYEPRDASVRPVLISLGGFVVLMVVGLVCAALLLGGLAAREERPRTPQARSSVAPPAPHLLSAPITARRRYEAVPARHVDPAALARAQQALVTRGWGEDAPPPATDRVARDHRGTVR